MSHTEEPSPSAIHTGLKDGDPARLEDINHPAFKFILGMGPHGMAYEQSSTHLLLPKKETEKKLRKAEKASAVRRMGNAMVRIDENNLPAEGKGEDRLAYDIISKNDFLKLLDTNKQASIRDHWAQCKGKSRPLGLRWSRNVTCSQ